MWPSQRVQSIGTVDFKSNPRIHSDFSRQVLTSTIEIHHTGINSPSKIKTVENTLNTKDPKGKVVFNDESGGDIRRVGNSSVYGSTSSINSDNQEGPLSGNVHSNEMTGQVIVQAICNRDSVIQGLGAGCSCSAAVADASRRVEEEELKWIQELEPEEQLDELTKLMIKLIKEREDRNEQLVSAQAQQKLVTATKPSKHHKSRHILCIQGRTIDGTDITSGNFPNSFVNITKLFDLNRDPFEFKRFTATVDMRGFGDEEISITNEGNILRFAGLRRKQGEKSAKIVTEEVILPKGVYADSLRIGRTAKGIIVIQEPWKF